MAKKKVDPADVAEYSANQLAKMGEAAFNIGMKVLITMGDNGGCFVSREVDPENGDALYVFDHYDLYRLVKED